MIVDEYLKDNSTVSLRTAQIFIGMLETGEIVESDLISRGVDLDAIIQRYGSRNGWTGTNGGLAAKLHKCLKEYRQCK